MPSVAELFDLGWKHHQAGGFAQAEQLYRQVIQADPAHADAWCFLGAACQSQGKLAEAETSLRRAVQLIPSYANAHTHLGMLLGQQGRMSQAVASFREALRYQPENAEIHNNLGLALARLGQLAEAVECYTNALRSRPDNPVAHYNFGLALNAQGRREAAISQFREALRLQPYYPEALNDLGNALAEQDSLDEAVNNYQQAVRLRPQFAEAYYNLGVVQVKQDKPEEAKASYCQALEMNPSYADAHFNLANVLYNQLKPAEAMTHFLAAKRLRPQHPETNLSCALCGLIQGDFEQGWPGYEWRWKQPDSIKHSFTQPMWDGSPLNGKTILLHSELGFGDTLQFIRYSPLVKERGGKVIVQCQSALVRLLRDVRGVDQLMASGATLPPIDVRAPLLSLPFVFRTTLKTIPVSVPYLQADAELVEKWRDMASRERKRPEDFLIGISWQGNPIYGHDRQRSIPLKHFSPLARVPGVKLISLQKGLGSEQLDSLASQLPVIDLRSQLDISGGAFMDTAALMKNLDLVISSDTAVAHLAGALGVPVWVALPFVPDWRWLLERDDCPWYPTMRLFRQKQAGNWGELFARIAQELKSAAVPQDS